MAWFVRPTTFLVFLCATALTLSGCAGATLNKKAKPPTPAERIAQLEKETQDKDQEIARVQQELAALEARETTAYETALQTPAPNFKPASGAAALRVPGVSVEQLQRALVAAGHNPGKIDGRFGNKTKAAVQSFQREQGLKVDGIVGQKTWDALKRTPGSESW